MPFYLGIDTSNYTTSMALLGEGLCRQQKQLLPVKSGERGLRQSDAVFHHVRQLPAVAGRLLSGEKISAIGVSVRPRNEEGSYMPCFLVGEGSADTLGSALGVRVHKTSHQVGHILAALYSADRLSLINEEFIAFHVSGGTTDCLLVRASEENVIDVENISSSLDLKAGQLIDRVGVMLGLPFPCGRELELLAAKGVGKKIPKPAMKGLDCCLSGIENQCRRLHSDGERAEDIALFCLDSVYSALREMTVRAIEEKGSLPIVYAGGVMSDKIIRDRLSGEFDAAFAAAEFSCDNAVGTAIYARIKEEGQWQG